MATLSFRNWRLRLRIPSPSRQGILCLGVTLILAAHRPTAFAQLAITEVMSFGSTNGLELGFRRPDFWELTNFGMNEVNLNGYRWFDSGNLPFESRTLLPATTIRPGESIVFVRESTVVPDPNAFRIWWGPSLPSDLQIYYWPPAPGFDDASGDAVRLWDANSNLVDEVRFASAREGVTFTYDTNSGDFSEFSQEGWAGAFRAATGGDIGSPGSATIGPVALQITQQPISQTVEPGTEVILRVQATGRPVPQYRWYSNGVPVLTAGAGVSTVPRLVCLADCGPSWRRGPGRNDLVLLGIQPGQSGDYFVEVFNGLEKLSSAVATITVNTNPSLIQVECPPEESCFPGSETDATAMLIASPGQTAIFSVQNRGFPLPTFQWSHSPDGLNFTNLPGETHRDLTIARVEASDAGLYRVRLENALGATTALGRLTIRPSPWLEITEAMSWPCSPFGSDWWELTNTNAEPVNLCGYRWDDATGSEPTIGGGPTITNNVIVQPGESVILLESQTAESFVQWWGASNLPPKLQFITYEANGLGELGDSIHLWDPNETDPLRFVAWAEFSGAIRGETRWFDLAGCPSGEFGVASRLGSCGAFQADRDCDVGSPGWTRWTPSALTSVRRAGPGAVVSWSAQPGSINRVQFARQLAFPLTATVWEDLGEFQFPKAAGVTTDSTVGAEPQRFYRVRRVTAANCPCPEE